MPLTARFFIPIDWISSDKKTFRVPPSPLMHQITSVLRMKIGDALILCPNDGTELHGHLTSISPEALTGKIDLLVSPYKDQPLAGSVTLAVAITKRDTYEWMLQKCTELGVTTFIPLHTERTIKKTPTIPTRWHDIMREASEQSGRVTIPTIHEPQTLKQALTTTKDSQRICLHESADQRWPDLLSEHASITLFIGPEGGFSPTEIALFQSAHMPIVQIGHLVLRAETAAIAATAKMLL